MTPFPRHGLYAIADTGWVTPAALPAAVAAVIRGGADVIQLRDKAGSARADIGLLRELLTICRACGVPFIINDDAELAVALGADGAHVSRQDADLALLRQRLDAMIIGVSCHNNLKAAIAAESAGADYVAFGRFFVSRTKPDAVAADLQLLKQARQQLHLPIVAIGGITPDNSARVLAAGADLLAVIEGLFGQPDPEASARQYQNIINKYR